MNDGKKIVIIGGGPAGLTAAYELTKRGHTPVVLERDSVLGGIARTTDYKGYKFDIGGHRFFTKVERVMQFWQEILKDDFLKRPRLSRIYYKGKFFSYPLKLSNVVGNLGLVESAKCFLSFVEAKISPTLPEDDFETYIVNRFGRRLFNTFFKSYTEKVWGIPCRDIRAEWAAQRIKGVSFSSVIKTAIFGNRSNKIKSLIEEFFYPKYGPGMLWERVGGLVERAGGIVTRGVDVVAIRKTDAGAVVSYRHPDGRTEEVSGDAVISTTAIKDLVHMIQPSPPVDVLAAGDRLRYRDFFTVGLIIKARELWPDNWIYIHDPTVKVGRVQNYKNWSPFMVPDPETTGIGLEYFAFEGDELWRTSDENLIALAKRELDAIGLLPPGTKVTDGVVIRMKKTYPIYDPGYDTRVDIVRRYLEKEFPAVIPVGRNGMHRYNNQDHSMLAAMLAVENLADGAHHDLWTVNTERVYHEEKE